MRYTCHYCGCHDAYFDEGIPGIRCTNCDSIIHYYHDE